MNRACTLAGYFHFILKPFNYVNTHYYPGPCGTWRDTLANKQVCADERKHQNDLERRSRDHYNSLAA